MNNKYKTTCQRKARLRKFPDYKQYREQFTWERCYIFQRNIVSLKLYGYVLYIYIHKKLEITSHVI